MGGTCKTEEDLQDIMALDRKRRFAGKFYLSLSKWFIIVAASRNESLSAIRAPPTSFHWENDDNHLGNFLWFSVVDLPLALFISSSMPTARKIANNKNTSREKLSLAVIGAHTIRYPNVVVPFDNDCDLLSLFDFFAMIIAQVLRSSIEIVLPLLEFNCRLSPTRRAIKSSAELNNLNNSWKNLNYLSHLELMDFIEF